MAISTDHLSAGAHALSIWHLGSSCEASKGKLGEEFMSRLQQAVCGRIKAPPAICHRSGFNKAVNCYSCHESCQVQESCVLQNQPVAPERSGREGQTI